MKLAVAVLAVTSAVAWPAPRGDAAGHCPSGAMEATLRGAGVPVRPPGSWGARLSADGRHVAFVSYDERLVPGDTNDKADVFRLDRVTGKVVRVSVPPRGGQFGAHAAEATISADGNRIAFATDFDVYVRDITAGRTTRVSVNSAGKAADQWSGAPVISPDGRLVAFTSRATNLVPLDREPGSIEAYLRTLETGAIERISVGISGRHASTWSWAEAISEDGRYVMFTAGAAGGSLTPEDVYPGADVFVRDRLEQTTEAISVAPDGRSVGGWFLGMSADGMRVLFGAGPQPDTKPAVFFRDRASATTRLIAPLAFSWRRSAGHRPAPLSSIGQRIGPPAALSADGRFAAVQTVLPTGPDDTNGTDDVVVIDLGRGTRQAVSRSSGGCLGNGASGEPSLSSDGSVVTFTSEATDLAGGDNGWLTNVYLRDLAAARTERIPGPPGG